LGDSASTCVSELLDLNKGEVYVQEIEISRMSGPFPEALGVGKEEPSSEQVVENLKTAAQAALAPDF
jgi:hypothetical protein